MREQAQIAIDTADVIIFMTDVRQGLVDADGKVADMLRRSRKPVVLVVNKVDSFQKFMMDTYEFYNLGIGEPVPISAASMLGLGDMLEKVTEYFKDIPQEEEESEIPRIAVVGKPNVGKSSLINKLLGEDRVIVSDIAGTTRDAIDTKVTYQGREYIFIDTAGLRRKNKIKEALERYSIIRTVTAVERADVVVLMIDAEEGVTEQDAKIAGIAHDRGKGIVIAVNKWDAIEKDDKTIYKFTNKVREVLSFMPYAEIMFISAKTGQRIPRLFETIDMVLENQTLRIQTGVLNEIITEAVAMQQPPSDKGKRLKIFYVTQVSVKPPTFVIFVNSKELMHFSYTRYLENKVREAFGFKGTSLKFIIRERNALSQSMLERIVCLAIGYVLGLFQTSYIYGRKQGIDIREHGSGNAGTTNAFRTMGKKAGALTLLGDILKCVLAMLIARLLFGGSFGDDIRLLELYAGAGCILGHNFPFYLKFKGGKGIAASVGLLLAFDWRIFLICAVVFFLLFFTTHYVSLCSLAGYLCFVVLLVIFGQTGMYPCTQPVLYEMYVVAFLLMVLAYWRHRQNIGRLLHGNENKIFLSKKR